EISSLSLTTLFRSDGVVNDGESDLLLRHLRDRAFDRLERALDIRLEDDLELLRLTFLDLSEHLVERRRPFRRGTGCALAGVLGDRRARGFFVGDHAHDVAGFWNLRETEYFDRA